MFLCILNAAEYTVAVAGVEIEMLLPFTQNMSHPNLLKAMGPLQ